MKRLIITKLPTHLQIVADKVKEIESKKGFTITDVTPEGFGPSEIGKPVLEGLKGETLDQAIVRSVGYQIDNSIVKLEETHDGWKATIAAGEGVNVFSATKKQSVLNDVQEFLNPGYKFRPAKAIEDGGETAYKKASA